MKEAVALGQRAHVGRDFGTYCRPVRETLEVVGRGDPRHCVRDFGRKESTDEEIGSEPLPGSCVVVECGLPGRGLAEDVVECVFRHRIEIGAGDSDLQHRFVVEQGRLAGGSVYVLVAFPERLGCRLVIAGERLVCVGRNTVRHDCGIEYADEAVTELDVGIEESQGFAGFYSLDPKCGSAEFHREGVAVDPMHTVPDYIAQCVLTRRFVRGIRSGVDPCHLSGHAPRCGKEKVPRAAGGVNDAEIEDGLAGILGMAGYRIGKHRVEGRLHQFVNEGRRRVVRPGQLSF